MKKVAGILGLVFVLSACGAEVKVNTQNLPNPKPNVAYKTWYRQMYETKVLKDPSNSSSELTDAVSICWQYSGVEGGSDFSYLVYTPVLKNLVTTIELEGKGSDFIEWKSEVKYRSDGVVYDAQAVIHYYTESISGL